MQEVSSGDNRRNFNLKNIKILKKIREIIESEEVIQHEIFSENPKSTFKILKDSIIYIKAGGGLIQNDKKQYLFIYRLGFWDLPKGKLELHENIEECAVREIKEECGIQIKLVKKELPSTYHIYILHDKMILKRTYWFLMMAGDNQNLIPQTEEGIEEVRWLKIDELDLVKKHTYPSILEVMKSIPDYIN